MASGRDLELNEVGWWAHWADVQWPGKGSYIILSKDFDEYFFNRAGFVDCRNGWDALTEMEAKFEEAGRRPCFAVQSECAELATLLDSRGYETFDEMSVMQLGRSDFKKATDLKVLQGRDVESAEWAATYALSFYGDLSLQGPVERIVDRLAGESSVILMAGEKGGRTLGVLAAFRTSGLLGVYCVGTIREQRGVGIAGSLIHEAARIASAESRLLVLQTIVSEGAEGFYASGGFRRLYLKHLMRRVKPEAPPSRRGA